MRQLTMLLVALAAALSAAAGLPQPARAAKGCGAYTGPGGPYAVRVLKGDVSCRTAQRVLRRYATSEHPCEGSSCVRTQRRWTCQAAAYHAFPRLFSCQRAKRRVAAYSLAH